MKVFISGGTGFVGGYLVESFLNDGHTVFAAGTREKSPLPERDGFQYIRADTTRPGDWQESISDARIIVNLAGRSIFRRWTTSYKQTIYDSRILTTKNIVAAVSDSAPMTLINISAVGFYGDCGDTVVTESTPTGNDFLARTARDWEAEALRAVEKGVRVAIPRFGVVLGHNGGALGKMIPAFKMLAGGPIGKGRQWFPWIHIRDVVEGIHFLVNNKDMQGPVNFSAPNPVRNKAFGTALGDVLNRPAVMPTPAFMLRLGMGEMADMLLGGQRAVPEKLLDSGYEFFFPDLKPALNDLLGQKT